MKGNPCQATLERARRGDAGALGELLESYRPYLSVLARALHQQRLQARVDDSDLVQDALLEAHRNFAGFRGSTLEELTAWLRQIVVRAAVRRTRDHLTAGKRNATREQPLGARSDLPQAGSSPSDQAIRHEEAARVAAALGRLPDDMREVLLGRHLEGDSYAALAERLGRSEGAVRVLYTRALRRLRDDCHGD
jgi:RNA polymerase sigma-70 factor (ECF subfamily)